MSQSIILTGSNCKIYMAGKLFPEIQSINYKMDYGEQEVYGIDSIFPQEIATTRMSVQGSVTGLRLKLSGGLQGKDIITKINQKLFAPYFSIEVRDRQADEKIVFIAQCKVVSQSYSIQSKGVVRVDFSFKGIIPYEPLDMN